jgi:hypothetical protein
MKQRDPLGSIRSYKFLLNMWARSNEPLYPNADPAANLIILEVCLTLFLIILL